MRSLERNSQKIAGRIQIDSALELIQMRKELKRKGITISTSSPYSLQPNEVAERMNRIIAEKVLALIDQCGFKLPCWFEAARNASDPHNCTGTTELKKGMPMRAGLCTIPDNVKFRAIGCPTFVHGDEEVRRDKFEDRSGKRAYVGSDHQLHRVCSGGSGRAVTTKHVSLDEKEILF